MGDTLGISINLRGYGISQQSGWDFERFAQVGGRYVAVGPEGLVVLEGDTDGGKPIDVLAEFAKTDLGDTRKKRLFEGYPDYRSNDDLTLAVQFDKDEEPEGPEEEFMLSPSPRTTKKRGSGRITFRRDQEGVFVSLTFRNKNGGNFSLNRLEIVPVILPCRGTCLP